MKINNFGELIIYIQDNDLSKKQLNKILFPTLSVFVVKDYSKNELIERLKEYYCEWHDTRPRPIFLDAPPI